MKELSLEESKKIQLGILVCIDRFCRENNIQYSMAYGTLLGAVRHKGFIPWDDDIDIVMLRPEYDRFVATYHDDKYPLVKGDGISNHLHVRVSDTGTAVVFPERSSDAYFYKSGLWVDVFPLDSVPEEPKKYLAQRKSIALHRNMQKLGELPYLKDPHSSIWKVLAKQILYVVLRPLKDYNGRKALNLLQKYNNTQSALVSSLSVWYWPKSNAVPKAWFSDCCEMEFEGHSFKAVRAYDGYLKSLYGDYMTLPPVEERKGKHDYKVYKRQ